jgi:hypothetical protein
VARVARVLEEEREARGGKTNTERSYSTSMSYYYGAAGKGGKSSGSGSSGYEYGGKGGKKRDEVI